MARISRSGSGGNEAEIDDRALGAQIELHAFVAPNELLKHYHCATLFVLPDSAVGVSSYPGPAARQKMEQLLRVEDS